MIYAIIALLILCGIADCVTTYIALRRPDNSETNPVAAWLMRKIGAVPAMLGLKVLCTATLCFVIIETRWAWLGAPFLAGYAFVLWNNVNVLREGTSS